MIQIKIVFVPVFRIRIQLTLPDLDPYLEYGSGSSTQYFAVLWIRIYFLRIRIRAWKLNTDPGMKLNMDPDPDPSQYCGEQKFICPYQ